MRIINDGSGPKDCSPLTNGESEREVQANP